MLLMAITESFSKGKNKTKNVYLLSKSFSDVLHHQCYQTKMKFYFLHFIKTGYYGDL